MKPLKVIEWRGAKFYITRTYPFLAEIADKAARRLLASWGFEKLCGVDVVGAPLVAVHGKVFVPRFDGAFAAKPPVIALTPSATYIGFWHEVGHYVQLCLYDCDDELFQFNYDLRPLAFERDAEKMYPKLEKQVDVAERRKVREEVKRARYELQKDVWRLEVSTSP